ncbi:MAG: cytochrome c oxidase accessory protein CcoG [Gemmatimonadota bacterium]
MFTAAPAGDRLYSLSAHGHRIHIHPRITRGRLWRIRRAIAYALIALFFALPLVPVGGQPAVYFDLTTRQFNILGAVFHPTDNLLLLAFGAGVIVTTFFVCSIFGRLWCGYTCPQNVYLEFVFRPIEMLMEGERAAQRRLDAAPWTAGKTARKVGKWLLWGLVSLAMAATFLAYFVSWSGLRADLLGDPGSHPALLYTLLGLAALILFDLGWFRDQMCTVACPYGRLQNVLADRDTVIPAYDVRRGEPRGRARPGQGPALFGDCVNCGSCVNACPTGVDIRRGLQLECVGIGQCMDACDAVMAREGRPPGLIRYTSERELETGEQRFWRPRLFIYLALMAVAWGSLAGMLLLRDQAEVEIVRAGQEPFRVLPAGLVANQQRLRLTNQLHAPQSFTVEILQPQGARLVVPVSPIVAEPAEVTTVNIVTEVPRPAFVDGKVIGVYRIRSDAGFETRHEFPLLGPYR